MRATNLVLAAALTLGLGSAALAQSGGSMPGMPMKAGVKHGQGTGVIKAIDEKAGSLVLQHGPIPAVSWPAMTMTFKAKPVLLKGLKAGQTVDFDCDVTGMSAEVTAIRPR